MTRSPFAALLRSTLLGSQFLAAVAMLQAAEFDQAHESLSRILQTYVEAGLVDYASLKTRSSTPRPIPR